MEERKVDRMGEYEVLGSFDCGDRRMVIIKAAHGTHVMSGDEWELVKRGFTKNSGEAHLVRDNKVA